MTDTAQRPAPSAPPRLRNDADVAAALDRARHPDTIARHAVPLLCAVLGVRPGHPEASALLVGHLEALGDPNARERAAEFAGKAQIDHPLLQRAVAAIQRGEFGVAAGDLRTFLSDYPEDPVALRLMANAAASAGQPLEAEKLLRRALEAAPDFVDLRRNLVDMLVRNGRLDLALAELDTLSLADPAARDYRVTKAAVLKRMRRTDEALALYAALLAETPADAQLLVDQGNAERGAGRSEAAIASYRGAAAAAPAYGRAWLSLAELKTVRFDAADVAAMTEALRADDLATEPRTALHFALGRALEQAGRYDESFTHYASANALHRLVEPYDAAHTEAHVRRTIALVKAATNPPEMAPPVKDVPTPIFIVGLPRSGSTLVEQILAAHPEIEATEELPYMRAIANDLALAGGYPASLAKMGPEQFTTIRARYFGEAAAHRRRGLPFFVDKAPANWQQIPLIVAAFPEARIIDARRAPLDCGFSNYTQRFGRGHEFAYSLEGIGHHYRVYAETMQAVAESWPGRVQRIDHEALVDNPEQETRRLLAYVGVDFDPACLAFHESREPVFSASSEQVRRPINRDGMDRWKPYEAWLGPLKRALGNG